MDDAPKRSLGDTITQLIVIAILLALIVGSVIFLRQYIDSRNSSDGVAPPSTHVALTGIPGYTLGTHHHRLAS
ncbi:MAG: hypothetical protein WCF25_09340 [Acidimicrobiales bacterium]